MYGKNIFVTIVTTSPNFLTWGKKTKLQQTKQKTTTTKQTTTTTTTKQKTKHLPHSCELTIQ